MVSFVRKTALSFTRFRYLFFELSDDEKNKIAINPPSRDISSGTGIQLCAMSAQPSMMNNTPTHFTTSTVSWKNTMAATMPST